MIDLKVELQKLALQVSERKGHIVNEEMTKQSLIIPFLQKMGYDVFNPLEVRAEYVADFGIKKGEKVDYAVFKNGLPIIFIEAKSVTEKLDKHSSQLSRYFNATPNLKIAILTNGVEYKFYTDLNQDNIMDNNPFFSFNIENLSNIDIETLDNFTKDNFDSEHLVKFAEELVYMSNLNATLKELFKNPTDEFLRFLIKDFSNSRITSNVIERFRPIVKKAISNTLLEIISEGLSSTKETAASVQIEMRNATDTDLQDVESDNEQVSRKGVVTTEEELRAYGIIRNILEEENRDISQVSFKDTVNYFTVYNRVITKWFLRVNLDAKEKYITTRLSVDVCQKICPEFVVETAPKGNGESRIRIHSIDEFEALRPLIVQCFDDSIL